MHWPGAGVILVASSTVVIVMLSLLLFRKPGPLSVQLPWPGMLVGSVIAVVSGVVFKDMYWPGANMLLLVGLSVCAAWFLISPMR